MYLLSMFWNCMLSQIVCDMYILNLRLISATHNNICLVKTGTINLSKKVEETYFFSFKCTVFLHIY